VSRHQIANIRSARLPVQCGDEATREQFEREVESARRLQPTRYAVSPRIRLPLPNGTGFLEAGAEVRVEQLGGGPLAPMLVLNRYLASGHVIEADGFDDGPEAA
jgi:hypothetical protein